MFKKALSLVSSVYKNTFDYILPSEDSDSNSESSDADQNRYLDESFAKEEQLNNSSGSSNGRKLKER